MRSSWRPATDLDMDWRLRAACRGSTTPDDWSTHARGLSGANRRALKVCGACAVVRQCFASYVALPPELRLCTIAGGVWWGAEGEPPAVDVRPDRTGNEQKAHGAFLTTRQAATVAGRFVGTIRAALAEGRLRGFQLPGGRWRIDRADLNDYVSPKRPTDDRCGSLTGISRHRRDHTPLCDRCRATKHEHEREWRRRRHSTR